MNKNKIYVKVKIPHNDLINNLMRITNYFNYKHKVVLINRHFGYALTRSVPDTPWKETQADV